MFNNLKKSNTQEDILYNNILLLSRNKLFFTEFDLADTFQNRIYLIFTHISFLFIKPYLGNGLLHEINFGLKILAKTCSLHRVLAKYIRTKILRFIMQNVYSEDKGHKSARN